MRCLRAFVFFTALPILLSVQASGAGSTNADFEGTWHWSTFQQFLGTYNFPQWLAQVQDIDATGFVTSGSGTYSDGEGTVDFILDPFPGPEFGADGLIRGPGFVGAMRLDHEVEVAVHSFVTPVEGGELDWRTLHVAIKSGGSFSSADLTGDWSYFGFSEVADPADNDPIWGRGTFSVDGTGTISGSSFVNMVDESWNSDGITLSINEDGFVTLSSGGVASGRSFKMDTSKNLMLRVDTETDSPNAPRYNFEFLVRRSDQVTFEPADLHGRWAHFGYRDLRGEINSPYWQQSVFELDASGGLVSGSGQDSVNPEDTKTLTGGSMTVDDDGLVSGGVYGSGFGAPCTDCQMDIGKDMIVGVSTVDFTFEEVDYTAANLDFYLRLPVPEPSGEVLASSALLVLGLLHQRRRRRGVVLGEGVSSS